MFRKLAIALSTTATLFAVSAFAANGPGYPGNKVTAAGLTVPNAPNFPGGPLQVSGSIQNATNMAQAAVDWTITDENAVVLGQGTISIGAGAVSMVGIGWTPAAGAHTLTFKADPLNKLSEPAAALADNVKTAAITTP